jgi:hypothetical protein
MFTVLVHKQQAQQWTALVGARGAKAVRYFLRSQLQLPVERREAYAYPIFEFAGAAELHLDDDTRPLSIPRSGPRARLNEVPDPIVVVLVLCRPEDAALRQMHRTTWIEDANSTSGGWRIVPRFMSGRATSSITTGLLNSEVLRYLDVVVLNVTDKPRGSNTDIAFKTFASLEWAARSFPEVFCPISSMPSLPSVCLHARIRVFCGAGRMGI